MRRLREHHSPHADFAPACCQSSALVRSQRFALQVNYRGRQHCPVACCTTLLCAGPVSARNAAIPPRLSQPETTRSLAAAFRAVTTTGARRCSLTRQGRASLNCKFSTQPCAECGLRTADKDSVRSRLHTALARRIHPAQLPRLQLELHLARHPRFEMHPLEGL